LGIVGLHAWRHDCTGKGMRAPIESTYAKHSESFPDLVSRPTGIANDLAKPAISSLRARFNPRLVGFGIAGIAKDISSKSDRAGVHGACTGLAVEDWK
jgi:hypothetical protein